MQPKRELKTALAVVAAGLFCYVAVSNITYTLLSEFAGELLDAPLAAAAVDMLCFALGMTASLLVLDIKGEPWEFGRITSTERLASLFAIPALLLPIQYISSAVDSFLQGIGIKSFEGSTSIPEGPLGLLIFVMQAVALPVFYEELVFRGLILKRLRPFGDMFAVVASSLFFALMHNTLSALPSIFLLGVIFCLADIAAGSLLPSVIMHSVNNLITVAAWYCMDDANLSRSFIPALNYLMIFSALTLPWLLMLLRRYRGKVFPVEKSGASPLAVFTSIPTIGFMAFMVYLIISVSEVTL